MFEHLRNFPSRNNRADEETDDRSSHNDDNSHNSRGREKKKKKNHVSLDLARDSFASNTKDPRDYATKGIVTRRVVANDDP